MSMSPLAYADSLRVGTIDFVSPDEIKVLLDIEAPYGVGLNAGVPRPFPRINGYVLIPNEEGYLVAQVEWITVERSQYPKRKGMEDFGLVDLPYPLRKMSLNPLGVLSRHGYDNEGDVYRFKRGVESYPTVGDAVLLPTQKQLRAVVESGDNRRVKIGTSPLAANAEVRIDPDRLFGRHLAVLGNTGSGKSCSVAGLIRWSLEAAKEQRGEGKPNARFIILDPNGEYSNTFRDMEDVRVFSVEIGYEDGNRQLKVPLWFWNSTEWSAFTQASGKTQRPLLRRALRDVKSGRTSLSDDVERELTLRRYLSSRIVYLRHSVRSGKIQTDESRFGGFLKAVASDISSKVQDHPNNKLEGVLEKINIALSSSLKIYEKNGKQVEYFRAFQERHITSVICALEESVRTLGGRFVQDGVDEDAPLAFDGEVLADHLEILAEQEGVTQFIDFLVTRIRTLLSDSRVKGVIGNSDGLNLCNWLADVIGGNMADNGSVSVIDLSLLPLDLVHVITAVLARVTLEALQRYRKLNHGKVLPTVLVMEEAHTFVKRYQDDPDDQSSSSMCCKVFEKIAREGRKFGLGLVLSSQRPSELSATVLSQCNTYLLHRISNDRDQDLVNKLLPDNLRGLLRDLPSLPSKQAILLGWASELPVLVQMNTLLEHQRPKSDDPDFWAVWSGVGQNGENVERSVDWETISEDWQQTRMRNMEGLHVDNEGDND